jgi:hypothetical protein
MTDQVLPIEGQPLTQVQRVVDTFIAPSKTFTDILRSSSWWLPFLLGVVVAYALTLGIGQKVGWSTVVDNEIQANPKLQAQVADASPEIAATIHKRMLYGYEGSFFASPVINILSLLFMAVILWPTINFGFAGKASYGQVFSVLNYAYLPAMIKGLIAVIVLYVGSSAENFTVENMLGTNPGYYIETPGALKTLLTSFDIFTLWTLVLLSMGLAIVARTKRSTGFIVVFGWWLLIVLVKTGVGALQS